MGGSHSRNRQEYCGLYHSVIGQENPTHDDRNGSLDLIDVRSEDSVENAGIEDIPESA